MYQYTFLFVLKKWQKSIQIIFYGTLSDTKQYLLHLRIEKKYSYSYIYSASYLNLIYMDMHGTLI